MREMLLIALSGRHTVSENHPYHSDDAFVKGENPIQEFVSPALEMGPRNVPARDTADRRGSPTQYNRSRNRNRRATTLAPDRRGNGFPCS